MNPNYFYDLGYYSPRFQGFEYNRLDPLNKVDMSVFYNEDMWAAGVLTEESRELLDTYHAIPNSGYENVKLGLEFDCGSVKPAMFVKFHYTDMTINNAIYDSVAAVVGLTGTPQPTLPAGIKAEDIGIFPERATGLIRYMVRGEWGALKNFALAHGAARASNLPDDMPGTNIWNTGVNFDWDGESLTNFTLHSTLIEISNTWVAECRAHCVERVAPIVNGTPYTLSQTVKIGLSDVFPDDYMKAYFTVRAIQNNYNS